MVPLKKGKHHHTALKDVFISNDEDWRSRHLKTLQSAYGSSPFFEHYIAQITSIYSKDWERITEMNLAILEWIIDEFFSSFPDFSKSQTYTEDLDKSILDLRDVLSPRLTNQIHIKPYNQVYEYKFGFTTNLSCLDLIFNTGPAFGQYI